MKFTILIIFTIINLSYIKGSDESIIWSYLTGVVHLSEVGAADLMGNLYAESGMKSEYYDIAYHPQLGLTDSEYVEQVNSGQYTEEQFVNDNIGFGLAQWKDKTRKQGLYEHCKGMIGNPNCQLRYIYTELKFNPDYKEIYDYLKKQSIVQQCTYHVMLSYLIMEEDIKEAVRRDNFSLEYYARYRSKGK